MTKEITTELGKIAVSDEVVATIAGLAATECYGVVGMASRTIGDGLAGILGKDNLSRGVEVVLDDAELVINVYIIVGYGTRISEVARNVVERVKYLVENATGVTVKKVNVTVAGVKLNKER